MPTLRDQIRVAFDPLWRKQSAFGTARAQADLTSTFTATLVSHSREVRKQFFYDCSNQVMRRQVATARLRRMTIEFNGSDGNAAGAKTITGFFAACAGVTAAPTGTDPKVQPIQVLPKPSRVMPVFTFRFGHEDGTSLGFIWKDVAVASVAISAAAGQDSIWRLTVNLVGNYNWAAATGTSWPACQDEAPLKLYDSSLTINAVERILTTRSIGLVLDNRPPLERTPYVAGSLDVARFWRAARRDYGLTAAIEGVEDSTDANYLLLEANSGIGTEVTSTVLRAGPVGESFTCTVPKADWSLTDAGQGYDGDPDAEEAVLNTIIMAKDVAGSADSPLNFTGTIPAAQLTQQMLLTA